MSTPVIYNGVTYNVPSFGDVGYAQSAGNMSAYWIALATGTLQKTGGAFTLTLDTNFGPNFGLLSKYFTSVTSVPATAGVIRLAKTDTIDWRNNANSGDNVLAVDGSNQLTYNGTTLTTGGITALTGDVTATGPGGVAATLATVNGSVGSFTNASITVNSKGLITAASNGAAGGVTSITGTANQVIASSPTGAVTLSLPQSIDTNAAVVFATALLDSATIESFGSLVFKDHTTHTVTIQAPNTVTSYGLVLPASQGAANSVLINDGAGNLSFGPSSTSTTVGTIAGSGTITVDASLANVFSTIVTGSLTIGSMINGVDGQRVIFRLKQDSGGPHTVTFFTLAGDGFRYGLDITSFTVSGANKIDYVAVMYDAHTAIWDIIAVNQGFAWS